jgi:hypothetical protein
MSKSWTQLPWELWVSVAAWLDLQTCFRLVRLFKRKQENEHVPLSPAELDLSRVERVHKLPPGFALTLGLARWKALRVLDLGTDPETVAGLMSELSWLFAELDQVRCIRSLPDGSGSSSEQRSDQREHIVVSNEYGYIRFAAVQIGPSFAVTWVLPNFAALQKSAIQSSQVESPGFRALGHDWRGVLYPRGNQTTDLTKEGSVSVYIENLTIAARKRGLGQITCRFRISVLASEPRMTFHREADTGYTFGLTLRHDRGWHNMLWPAQVQQPEMFQDGALVLKLELIAVKQT